MKNQLSSFKYSSVFICFTVLGLLFSPKVFGGVLIDFEVTNLQGDSGKKKGQGRMSVDAGKSLLKIENDMGNLEEWTTMIFNEKKQVLEIYDHQNKQKRVMDDKSAQQMQHQMQGFQKQMNDMMKNMTEEQRAMMKQMGRGAPPSGIRQGSTGQKAGKVVKTRKREKVMGMSCVVYEVFDAAGNKQLDLCATDVGNIPEGNAVRKLMGGMGEFYKKIFSSMPMGGQDRRGPFEIFNKVEGFPLRTTHYQQGRPAETSTLTSVKKAGFKAATFDPFPEYPAVGMMEAGKKMRKMRRSPMPGRDGTEPGMPQGQPMDLNKLLEGMQQRK